jgi:hypothetical protein
MTTPAIPEPVRDLLAAILEAVTLPCDAPEHARRMEIRAMWVHTALKGALEEDLADIGWDARFLRSRIAAEETEATERAARASVDRAVPVIAAFLADENTERGEGQ